MQCPKCGGHQHRIPESRKTDDAVWRRRICLHCHHVWVTQEINTDLKKLPTEVHRYKNEHRKPAVSGFTKEAIKKFDTGGLASFRW